MRVIESGNSIINSVIGEQTIKDTEYRPMKYVIEIEVEDGLLLHSVLTGRIVLLTNEEKSFITQLPIKPEEKILDLISWYYLVPVQFNEQKLVQGYRKVLQQIEKNKEKPITKYTIFPTTCCNAHCFYCFESEYNKTSMDETTASKVVEFIRNNSNNEKVKLIWFGGEPTVAEKCIDNICNQLKSCGIEYMSAMVSNGYLFSDKMVHKATNEWKLENIQITLDGTEEIYNSTKRFNVEGSPYKRVLNNIKLLLDAGVNVSILLNLDYHNYEVLFELVDELSLRYGNYSNFRVSSHVLFNDEGYERVHHTVEEEEELVKRNYRLGEYAKEKGLNGGVLGDVRRRKKGKIPVLRHLYCMANDSGAIVIGPNGSFYKCEHIDHELNSPARLDTTPFDQQELDKWFEPIESKSCFNCCLYPDCFVPVKCQNHVRCYPIDFEKKVFGYKENVKDIYYRIVHSEKGGENNEKV